MKIYDGFRNFVAGLGVAGQDKSAANTYIAPNVNLDLYNNLYRSSGFGRRVIDIPAGDMTREWRTWLQETDKLKSAENHFKVRKNVKDLITQGTLEGGAGIYIGLKGVGEDALAEPLDPEAIGKDSLEYLTVFSRQELNVEEIEDDPLSPRYQRGKLYSINRGSGSELRIHWSRFAWFGGVPTSTLVAEQQDGWDDPIYTTLQPLIEAADSALANLVALIHEARVDVIKIPELTKWFEDSESEAKLTARILATQHLKSNLHMLVLDGNEEHDSKHAQFTGLVEVYSQALQSLAGAADIPITRFLGTSPGGMNATGESDTRNYYDGIQARQENQLTSALEILDGVLFRHATGKAPEDTELFTWNPLWQLSEKERAETSKIKAETTKLYFDMGIIDDEILAESALSQIKDDEIYPALPELLSELGEDREAIQVTEPEEATGASNVTETETNQVEPTTSV